jgi:uncharacterized protein
MEAASIVFGRQKEQRILLDYCTTTTSAMLAIVGRRRIGKTFLIRKTLANKIDFEMTGYQNATKAEQLQNFILSLSNFTNTAMITQPPKNWLEAFHQLKQYLIQKKGKQKKVIFIDELPWIATSKSGFVEALAHFWNDWASENNVLFIICGSAASWMLKNVVNNKGGLHNRIQQTIHLQPFSLYETKAFLEGKKIKASDYQIMQLYMVLGGVPYYLSLVEKNKSILQNINALLFEEGGKLINEFDNIFLSLFDKASNHINVIQVLSTKLKGCTRNEIAKLYSGTDGGGLTQVLEELTLSGFITKYTPFQKLAKDALYRITDPYLLFYFKYLRKKNVYPSYTELVKTQSYKIWSGYAFENLCLYHIPQINRKLNIQKYSTTASTFLHNGKDAIKGFQVDLLLDCANGIIYLCEIKFYEDIFVVDKTYSTQLLQREVNFTKVTKTKKSVHTVMISANGIAKNNYANTALDKQILGLDLFHK